MRLAHAVDLSKTGLSSAEAYALLDAVEDAGDASLIDADAVVLEIAKHYLEAVAE